MVCSIGDMARMVGTSDALMTNSHRSKRARGVNFRELSGVKSRRAPGAGAAAAEQALALLHSGEVSSQAAAAAALGISQGQLSALKTQHRPAYSKFNQQPTRLVTVCGVTYTHELSYGDETHMPTTEKAARASRNYRRKMAAFREAARDAPDNMSAVLKEEGAVPPMPLDAVVKEEEMAPPMPPGAFVKEEDVAPTPFESVVKREEEVRSHDQPKRQRSK